ncbi:uncharacterized protein LOC131017866 [Salvia miltiorrhiza]|uniref:uncharacterized protein LOC131017866 n=1 Tax=Salvia miltiorrhiza TaxID=226208 RepID=UPI0025ABA6A4|nr:uncharacterized protein LOC131017866 [Salvia miltiorrhiza]
MAEDSLSNGRSTETPPVRASVGFYHAGHSSMRSSADKSESTNSSQKMVSLSVGCLCRFERAPLRVLVIRRTSLSLKTAFWKRDLSSVSKSLKSSMVFVQDSRFVEGW